ncbi:MAG: YfhO family protein, partial [Bacteroidales bacterium]|nr:YfhO family protein [Bacteroidales bacterium]
MKNNTKDKAITSNNTSNLFSNFIKKTFPHICAIIIMYVLTITYFSPVFFDSKELPQGDMVSVEGMTQEVKAYQEKTGDYSEWTNSMFSGMPTTTLWSKPSFNIFYKLSVLLRGGLPLLHAGMLFAYLLGFYIFMLCIGANAWMALLGAVVYAFASYNIIIIEAGHVTKGYAMAYLAPMIGGIILAFRKKYWLGAIITLLFLGIEISCNHLQIIYYGVIIVGIIGLVYFFYYLLKEKTLKPFFKAMGVLVVAAILAVIPNMGTLLPTYIYSKDTMRGGSELTIVPEERQQSVNTTTPNEGGLEKDYAFA